jgi:hypothetical protein
MLSLLCGSLKNSKWLFIVMCTICRSKNAVCIPILNFFKYTKNDSKQLCFEHMTSYSMPFNKVPYTSNIADTRPTYSCIHRNSIYFRFGKKNSLNGNAEHFYMHNDIMPNFILQEGETWKTVFCFGARKEEEKNRIKCKRTLLYYPQHLVQRTMKNVKIKREYLFGMPLCRVTWEMSGKMAEHEPWIDTTVCHHQAIFI